MLTISNYERLVPSAIQVIIGKTDPLCGAAQHTGVWRVPRPDIDRVCDRNLQRAERAFKEENGERTDEYERKNCVYKQI